MFLEISWPRRLSIKAEKAFCTNSIDYFFIYCVKEVYYDTKCIFLKRLKEWNFLLKKGVSHNCVIIAAMTLCTFCKACVYLFINVNWTEN